MVDEVPGSVRAARSTEGRGGPPRRTPSAVVSHGDVREAGDRRVRLPDRREAFADARSPLRHRRRARRPVEEPVGDAQRPLDRLRRGRARPDRRRRALHRRRPEDTMPAIAVRGLARSRGSARPAARTGASARRSPRRARRSRPRGPLCDAEHEPAGRELVDHRGLLRDEHLVAVRELEDRRREPDRLGHTRRRRPASRAAPTSRSSACRSCRARRTRPRRRDAPSRASATGRSRAPSCSAGRFRASSIFLVRRRVSSDPARADHHPGSQRVRRARRRGS